MAILESMHGRIKAKKEMEEIQIVLSQEKMSASTLLRSHFVRIILLGAIVSIFTQAVGINAIIYYAPTIFEETGFSQATVSILATVGIGFTVTFAAVIAAIFIDKVGRRKLLLFGLAGIILSLAVIIFSFYFIKNPIILGWMVLSGSVLFVLCQGLSVGPACFLIPSEIFPVKIRGLGMGIAIAFNWLTNAVVAFLFPIVLGNYGATSSFVLFFINAVVGWVLFYLYVPETRNVSLEQIEMNLLSGIKTRNIGNHFEQKKYSSSSSHLATNYENLQNSH
jgi:MFS family permease